MQSRTDILNYLIETLKLETYCEIGTQNRASNFNKVKAPLKYCVDPDAAAKPDFIGTSDDFFSQNTAKYDLFFIDGLHHAEQVYKDYKNALNCLSDKGVIVLHDMLPVHPSHAEVPRVSKVWNGDVYRVAFLIEEHERDNLAFVIVDIDHGCGVIWKKINHSIRIPYDNVEDLKKYNWDYYQRNRMELPIVTTKEFQEIINPFK